MCINGLKGHLPLPSESIYLSFASSMENQFWFNSDVNIVNRAVRTIAVLLMCKSRFSFGSLKLQSGILLELQQRTQHIFLASSKGSDCLEMCKGDGTLPQLISGQFGVIELTSLTCSFKAITPENR